MLNVALPKNKVISIENLSKSYVKDGNVTTVFDNFNCMIETSKTLCIFAPNGAGKTTLLNIIAGIDKQYNGRIVFPEQKRPKISYMMQRYTESLLPWRDLWENIAFPLSFEGVDKEERLARVSQLVKEFDIEIPKRYPYVSSGGERQKACLLRAFINKPDILLMDEPFSALDFETKDDLQIKLMEILARSHVTCIIVSHDPDQVVSLGQRVIVLSNKPASIVDDFEISLGANERASPTSREYMELRAKILESFRKGNR